MRLVGKFNKTKKQQENQIRKQGGIFQKNKPKMNTFTQKHAQIGFFSSVGWNSKSAIKFQKEAMRKTEICEKQSEKTSNFQRKQVQKQATCKSSKNPQLHEKTSPNSRENRKVGHTDSFAGTSTTHDVCQKQLSREIGLRSSDDNCRTKRWRNATKPRLRGRLLWQGS